MLVTSELVESVDNSKHTPTLALHSFIGLVLPSFCMLLLLRLYYGYFPDFILCLGETGSKHKSFGEEIWRL